MTKIAQTIMTAPVKTLTPDMSLVVAGRFLAQHQLSGAPVVDGEGVLVGILSHADIFRATFRPHLPEFDVEVYSLGLQGIDALLTSDVGDDLERRRVEDVMTRDPVTVAPTDPILKVAAVMTNFGVHRVLVVKEGVLLGIISSMDLIKLLA